MLKKISFVVLCLSLTFVTSEQIEFSSSPSSSSPDASDKESSSSSADHEESEQMQAFVIADPSFSASNQSPVVQSASQDDSRDGETETINPIAASLLLNLALNNMAATMSHGSGGQPFRTSRDCGCGCKCGHGRDGPLCPHCTQRGWSRGSPCPCANKHSSPNGEYQSGDYAQGSQRVERMAVAPFYHYPVYYDAATGIPLPGQERNAQLYHPFGANSPAAEKAAIIAAASNPMPTYVRPTIAYRYSPRYVVTPQYYYPGPMSPASPAASYPIPTYAYPPSYYGQQSYTAASSSVPTFASYSRLPLIMAASRRSSMSSPMSPFMASPFMAASSPYTTYAVSPHFSQYAMVMPKYYAGYY